MENKGINLEQWQDGFESVAVDIVGFCNAKCKYCPSGNDLSHYRRVHGPCIL